MSDTLHYMRLGVFPSEKGVDQAWTDRPTGSISYTCTGKGETKEPDVDLAVANCLECCSPGAR